MIVQKRLLPAGAAVLAILLVSQGTLHAQGFEQPPSFQATKIRGVAASGEAFAIKDPVRSDGQLRIYRLDTPYGEVGVLGDQMLRMRQTELKALADLEKISHSEAFGKALVEAGLSPLKYTGRLLTNPVQTIGDTMAGIGNFFGSIGSGIANAGKTSDNPVAGLLGVTRQRRELAARFGVDPYTDFAPLSERLERLSEAAATAGLTVSGALFFVPGAAGIVVSNLRTADSLGNIKIEELARGYTAAQIMDLNRQRLVAMGVAPDLIEALLANRHYTPVDMAVMVAALDSMKEVGDRALFFRLAAGVDARPVAYFVRRRAEMLSDYAKRAGLARFVVLGGYPFNVTRDNRVVGLMPLDALSWTPNVAQALGAASADRNRLFKGRPAELRLTGTATAMARARLKVQGWTVVENASF